MKAQFSHLIFDFAFLRGPDLAAAAKAFPSTDYDHSLIPGGGALFVSKNDSFQKKTAANGCEYFFIGDVFFFDLQNLEKSDGHYVGFKCEESGEQLTFFRNRNSHIGLYYSMDTKNTAVFSALYQTQRKIKNHFGNDLNSEAFDDFFQHGFITFGQTPFKKVNQVPLRKKLQVTANSHLLKSEADVPLVDDVITNHKDFFDFFQERMSIWLSHANYKSIALSGGLDSRFLVSCWLNKNIQRNVTLHSRLHPNLEAHQDRDVIIAKQVAALTNLKFEVQKAQDLPSAFLSQEQPCRPPVMSGLYGGEYLGGEFLRLVSLANFDSNQIFDDSPFVEKVLAKNIDSCFEDNVSLKIEILAQSSLCAFYGGAWGPIATHHNLMLTPFWDTYFIEALSKMKADQLRDYALYNRIFSHFQIDLRELPLNSQMNCYHANFIHSHEGLNPKLVPFSHQPATASARHTRDLLPSGLKSQLNESHLQSFQNFLFVSENL